MDRYAAIRPADDAVRPDPQSESRTERTPHAEAFARHGGLLKRVIAGMGLGAPDRDDILQEVFLAVLKESGEGKEPMQAKQWLVRVTINRCLQEFRRRRRFSRAVERVLQLRPGGDHTPEGPEQAAIRAERLEAVRESLKHLSDALLAPLALRFFCDFNAAEIGELLQLNPSTVRSRLRDARLRLAERLTKRGIEP